MSGLNDTNSRMTLSSSNLHKKDHTAFNPTAQRVFIGRRRSHSTDSRRSKEYDLNDSTSRKKRKSSRKDDQSRSSSPHVGHRQSATHPRKRKQRPTRCVAHMPANMNTDRSSCPIFRTENSRLASSVDGDAPPRAERIQPRLFLRRPPSSRQPTTAIRESAEVDELKKVVTDLQKETELARKAASEQVQTIESLRRELAAARKISRKQGAQIEKLKVSGKKSEDLLNAVQGSLQCQICLELLVKPFALSPCGHVLCQECLQRWFRDAPRRPHEDLDIHEPIPTIFRIKTCPCCRSIITHRPIPLFIIKDLVANFSSSSRTDAPGEQDQTSNDGDPWLDIFPYFAEISTSDEEMLVSDEGSDVDSDTSTIDSRYLRLRIFSDSELDSDDDDDESSEFNFVPPAWRAPAHRRIILRRNHPTATPAELELMQRGVSMGMIERYRVRLSSNDGIIARLDDSVDVYLGWNIVRNPFDHEDGREFMAWVADDIIRNEEAWMRDETTDRIIYRRMVPDYRDSEVLTPIVWDTDAESQDD